MALEVKPLEGANSYRQSKHIQFNPLPMRAAMLGNTGQGKTAASFVIWRELFPLCNRWRIIASTIETDGSFSKMKEMVTKGLRDKGIDPDDPGENPFHTSLDALGQVIKQATMHTKRGKDANEKHLPMTLLYIDDMITFTRWNSQLDHLFATSRHIGLNIIINMQQFVGMSTLQRKSLSHIGLFRIHKREADAVKEEIAGRKDADFEQAFQEATKKNYGFLWVRLQAKSPNEKYWSSFTKRIHFD